MSFPRYPEYKDSGVEWLGEVPGHWEVKPIKAVSTCNDEVLPESTPDDYEIEYVEISDVNEVSGITDTSSLLFGTAPSRARRIVRNGDILVSTVRIYLRAITPVINPPENMIASTGFAVIRPRSIEPHYLGYVFQTEYLVTEVIARSVGVSYPAINASELMHLITPFPATTEQQSIATFIDRETAKIDALIAEQQRLIELLKEKRQAVISHAVTKGLNPSVPMKGSGIEWLGEVPAHWIVCALNYRYEIALGKMLDEKRITGNQLGPYLRNVDVQWGRINIENLPEMDFSGDDLARYSLRKGDFLVCEGGEAGRAAIWNAEIKECFYQKALHRLRVRDSSADQPCFLFWVLNAAAQLGIFAGSEGKATINHLTAETFRRYMFAFPPSDEQCSIAVFLNEESTNLNNLTTEAQRAIALLKERRTALISASVTGKIDVRQWQHASEQSS